MRILCFEIKYVGLRPNAWQQIAQTGDKIGAIKELRNMSKTFVGLREAKDEVDAYMYKHHIPVRY